MGIACTFICAYRTIHCTATRICIDQKDSYRLCCAALSTVAAFALLASTASLQPPHLLFIILLWVLIAAIDLYVIFLLICTAVASSTGTAAAAQRSMAIDHLPSRPGALIILFLYLAALIAGFAALYLDSNEVARNFDSKIEHLCSMGQALYFSAVTMTTLGYGDFQPTGSCARWIVILQLISGFIVLIAAIPLLIGRLTMWTDQEDEPAASVAVTGLQNTMPFYTDVLDHIGLKLMHKGSDILIFGNGSDVEIRFKNSAKIEPNTGLSFVKDIDFANLANKAKAAGWVYTGGELTIDNKTYNWALVRGPNEHEITVRAASPRTNA